MVRFSSRAIARAEYNEDSNILSLWFVGGVRHYDYYNVPQNIFDGLCRAASKGTYFNRFIKDRYSRR